MNEPKIPRNVNIAMIMIPKVSLSLLHAEDSVRQGLEMVRRRGYTAVPVLDESGVYLGSVTEGDFLRHMMDRGTTELRSYEKDRIRDIFRSDYCKPLSIQAPVTDLVKVALEQNFVPIVDDNHFLCGMVTRRSIIQYLWQQDPDYIP